MKLATIKLNFRALEAVEKKQGERAMKGILTDWFGRVGVNSILDEYQNYKEGLNDAEYEFEIEVASMLI